MWAAAILAAGLALVFLNALKAGPALCDEPIPARALCALLPGQAS